MEPSKDEMKAVQIVVTEWLYWDFEWFGCAASFLSVPN